VATFADSTGKVSRTAAPSSAGRTTITPSMLATAARRLGVGMLNATLAASVRRNALTIAVKNAGGQ